jgi:two-component system, chemotaxis family, protein-glutamate methylesterase/glutaminase
MERTEPERSRGVIAIGASAGGVDALQRVVRGLPGRLPAAVCIVLHIPATARSVLADVIARGTVLPVQVAKHGDRLLAGRVFVAPPDRHLLVRPGRLALDSGPKEHAVRPAIDPLFRSVAAAYGARAMGIVLSGSLDDGAAGLAQLAAAGGTALVQDPEDAFVRSMPEAALAATPAARALRADELGNAIASFARGLPMTDARERRTVS